MEQVVQALPVSVDSLGTSLKLPDLMARMITARADLARNVTLVCPPELMQPCSKPCVLLIDQRCGGDAAQATFIRMVTAAQSEHSGAEIWIWPAVRDAAGGLSGAGELPTGTHKIVAGFSFFATLSCIDHTYMVSAPKGMQALLVGIPVHVPGRSYYASQGLTTDDLPMPDRHHRPTPAALFDVIYLRFARYLGPETHGVGTLERSLDSIRLQRMVRARCADCERAAGVRFQLQERFFATPFLTAGGSKLRQVRVSEKMGQGERVAPWGGKSTEGTPASTPVLRMEDGFFHSDGLGSDMNAPCSQVLDREGLYFDAYTPNELMHTLNSAQSDDAELVRAAALRELIARLDVAKYSLGQCTPGWNAPVGKMVILATGQVADDASIHYGAEAPGMAEALLGAVRKRNPDGFTVYEPYPDVLFDNRQGLVHAHELADIVDVEPDVVSLVDRADEVHVLPPLVGFDVLLRDKRILTYGSPFYVGRGLIQDALEQPWRQRKLTPDILVAGVLLYYPIYWDWHTRLFITPEAVVRKLGSTAARPLGRIADDWKRSLRKVWRWSRSAVWYGCWAWAQRRQARLRGVLQRGRWR